MLLRDETYGSQKNTNERINFDSCIDSGKPQRLYPEYLDFPDDTITVPASENVIIFHKNRRGTHVDENKEGTSADCKLSRTWLHHQRGRGSTVWGASA